MKRASDQPTQELDRRAERRERTQEWARTATGAQAAAHGPETSEPTTTQRAGTSAEPKATMVNTLALMPQYRYTSMRQLSRVHIVLYMIYRNIYSGYRFYF